MKKILLVLPLALLAAACNKAPETTPTPAPTPTPSMETPTPTPAPVTMAVINLSAQSNSGQTGTATLTEVGGKAKIVIDLKNTPANSVQPSHVHIGSCAAPGGIKYPLSDIKNGKSETTLTVSLATLLSEPFMINAHKSAKDINTYMACGDSTQMVTT